MKLRPMTMADADKMLEWKNYPETRKFAILNHDLVSKEKHYEWLPKNLHHFQIINDGEGAIRVEDGEVSIWIDRAYWGKGLATEAVKKVSQPGMMAKIVDGNVASLKCFIRAGYEPVDHIDSHYILKKV